jgi:hypothetical protein
MGLAALPLSLGRHCGNQTAMEKKETAWDKGCLGEFEIAFDGEVEAIADILEYVTRNQIAEHVTIHSGAQAAITRVGHTGTRPGQDHAIRVKSRSASGCTGLADMYRVGSRPYRDRRQ